MENYVIIYVTFGEIDNAKKIVTACLKEKLIACANIFPRIGSVYFWEGEIKNDNEIAVFLKTTKEKIDAVTSVVKKLHNYDCPCIIALPIESGNSDFLKWISDSVKA